MKAKKLASMNPTSLKVETRKLAIRPYKKQRGSSLYISVMILLLVAISGLTVFSSSLLNQKIANNYVNKNISYQAVENVFASILSEQRNLWQSRLPATDISTITNSAVTNNTPGAATTLTLTYLKSSIPSANEVPDGYPLNDLLANYYQADVSGQFAKANSTHRMSIAAFVPAGASGDSQGNIELTE